MISLVFRYAWAFVLLILFQVLILNNLHLSIYLNPYAYILFIIILPFETPGWLILSLAFIMGIIMDAFSNTPGLHSASLVLLAFSRSYLLKIFSPRDGYESGESPHYNHMGLPWFLVFAGILTLIHHLSLFYLEDFRLDHFFSHIFKAILSSIISLILMVILLLSSYKPKQ